MKRQIFCRFDNQADLNTLSSFLPRKIDTTIAEYDLDDNKVLKLSKRKHLPVNFGEDKYGWRHHYRGMPIFQSKEVLPYHLIIFHTTKSPSELTELFKQQVTDRTKSIWFPQLEVGKHSKYRLVCGESNNKYPIYVVSKGRSNNCSTSKYLSQMEVKHFVAVEPNEVSSYKSELDLNYATVLEMDMSYKDNYDTFSDLGKNSSTGPGAVRNFCWEHSIKNGHKWHWVMDDNAIEGFHYLYQNTKIKSRTGAYFRACEDFVDRYDNIAIGGLNYTMFCKMTDKTPPYILNTRIYSFLLIRNDIPYRWRGRYNEDTDLSLRVLKDDWCTIQFNFFLAGKSTTQRVSGGNTKEFYKEEGTKNKSQMLVDMHPDVAKMIWRFNRWHHTVDYSGFKQRLKLNDNINLKGIPKVDNYGTKIIKTIEEETSHSKMWLESKYSSQLSNYKPPVFNTYDKEPSRKKPLSFAELMRAKKSKK
ncbi:beta-glucosyl-HMC-alpha-glucosyltransferase [Tenacibaculum phage PTm1]|uniref:TET-Associated Glycosyltransferase domain-containing protein n=2 Tax=Shirahamavirus PTm1 TaxID=2846435 RepID=A0A5S9HXN2_9CAUD|nr:beta-glucosyl-HMC-alpha-glucosyltransferase [Tenacibaculum phage PTm1]BBI90601.1 hypothetical protein [Tenacibaculum phage PTm1]BBI90908.1 hypothetical protein [Tenacibaculum phage PTm5]